MTVAKTVGIDVAAARPCTCVLLEGLNARHWFESRDVEEIRDWVADHRPEVVAVDAPSGVSKGLLVNEGEGSYAGRVCDRDLRRRGIPLYEVPQERSKASAWMQVGFRLYELLGELGYRLPSSPKLAGSVIEVYPHASFVTLLGATPARKSTPEGRARRIEILKGHHVSWEDHVGHDSLDALVGALTACKFLEGEVHPVGDLSEALLWLPVSTPRDSYSTVPIPTRALDLAELEDLRRTLTSEQRDELLECLLIAASRGGEAMLEVLDACLLDLSVRRTLEEL